MLLSKLFFFLEKFRVKRKGLHSKSATVQKKSLVRVQYVLRLLYLTCFTKIASLIDQDRNGRKSPKYSEIRLDRLSPEREKLSRPDKAQIDAWAYSNMGLRPYRIKQHVLINYLRKTFFSPGPWAYMIVVLNKSIDFGFRYKQCF